MKSEFEIADELSKQRKIYENNPDYSDALTKIEILKWVLEEEVYEEKQTELLQS